MAKNKLEYKISADATKFQRELKRASASLNSFQKVHKKGIGQLKTAGLAAASGLTAVTAAATTAAVALSVKATKAAATFERAIVSAGAKSAATGQQLKAMQAAAIGAASGAEFSAQQAAEAMGFLAAAGFDVEQQMRALPAVLNLASAGELELAESADLASNVLSQFGFDVAELGRVNDVLVKAANSANTSVHQLGEALSYAGPAAAGAGISLEETVAMIGKLSDAGLQADRAGTGLQQVMAQLGAAGKKLGVDLNGTRIANLGLAGSLRELEKAGLNAQNAGEFFTTRAKTSLQAILLQGIPAVEGLDKALQSAGGTAQEVADKKIDTLQGSINILTGNFDNLMVLLGQKFAPAVKFVADETTAFIESLKTNDSVIQSFANAMADLAIIAAGVTQAVSATTVAMVRFGSVISFNFKNSREAADSFEASVAKITGSMTSFAARIKSSGNNMSDLQAEILAVDTALRDSNTTVERRIELEKRLGELQQKQRQQNLEQLAGRVDPLANARASLTNYLDELTEQRDVIEREAQKLGVGVNVLGTLGAVDFGAMSEREREHVESLRSQYQKIGLLASDTRQRVAATTVELERSVQAMEQLEASGDTKTGGLPSPDETAPRARATGKRIAEELENGFRGEFGSSDMLSAIALETVAEKRGADMAAGILSGFNVYVESQEEAYRAGQRMYSQLTEGVDEMMAENERIAQQWADIWDNASDRVVTVFSDSVGDAFLGVLEGNVDAVKTAIKGLIKEMVLLAAKAAILKSIEAGGGGTGILPSVLGFASGGHVRGPGSSTSDSIPARLSNNEYVIQAKAVKHWGVGAMEAINQMRAMPKSPTRFATGGLAQSGGGGESIRIINVTDPAEIEAVMSSAAGERVVFNTISRRSAEIKRILS